MRHPSRASSTACSEMRDQAAILSRKAHVGIVHLARGGALAGEFGEHVGRGRARRGDEIGRKACAAATLSRVISVASASMLSRSISASAKEASAAQACVTIAFNSASSVVPGLERDDALAGAVRLVEARAVIERREAIEPERDVGAGADEFGGVDHARLQRDQNFARRGGLRYGAEPAIDFAAEAERADFQAVHVVAAFELAAKPAAHAHAGVAAHERLDAERRVELVPQRLAAAGVDPGDMLVRHQPERHRGEEGRRRLLALPIERGGVAHLGDAGADRVEHLEGRHDLARGRHGDFEPAAGQRGDAAGDALRRQAGTGQPFRP